MGRSKIKGLLLDLNGVFFADGQLLPGAAETVELLRNSRLPYRYVTNTTTMKRASLIERLREMGLDLEEGQVLTPVQAAISWLHSHNKKSVHLVMDEDLKGEFSDFTAEPTNPEAIVVGDIGDRWNFKIINHLFELMMYGADLVALHKGRYWQKDGRLHIDIGAIVAGLEYSTGHQAVVIGKPSPSFYEAALSELGLSPGEVAMIGDDIESDVGGAQALGLQGILVRTGKYRDSVLQASSVEPDAVLDGIGSLAGFPSIDW